MKRASQVSLLVAALCVWAAGPALAQSQAINGSIEGTLKDPSGGVLPGVNVTLVNVDTGAQRVIVTNPDGLFRAPLLPLGTYTVTFELTGFQKLERTNIALSAGQTVVLNETLGVGGTSESVTVTSEAPVVDLGKIDVGRNITSVEMHNLPNVSRNPYNFALLEPGVTGFENSEFGVPRFAVNGQMERINYQIDGSTNTQKDRAGLRLMPMSEVMIREVQVVSAGYAPEFGQTTGMVYNAVTPSGTNQLRGDVGYRFRLKDWSAFPFYFRQPRTEENRPDNSLDIFTVTLGGPIVRNKLQYYFGLEHDYNRIEQNVQIDPGVASAVGLPAQPAHTGAYRSVTQPIGKVDWTINGANRAAFRVNTFSNKNPFNQSGGGNNATERAVDFIDSMYSASTQLVSTLGSSRLNELRIQYARRHQTRFAHDDSITSPTVNITGGTVNGVNNNIDFGQPSGQAGQDFTQGIAQLVDNFTWLRGSHNYKTGIDLQWIHDFRAVPLVYTYTFPSVAAYLDAQSGRNPKSYTTFAQTLGEPNLSFDDSLLAAFVQDDWKVNSQFKFLYGVRYDYYMYPHGVDPDAPYNATFHRDRNNLAPRGGFAWTIDKSQKTVLRGSSGIMYDQPLLATVENAYTSSGLPSRTINVSLNPGSPNAPAFPATLSTAPTGTVLVSSTVEGMAPDYVTAYTWQNTITLARELSENYSASVDFRYTRGHGLPVITDVNLAGASPIGTLEDGRGLYSTAVNAQTRVDPRYNHVQLVQSIGESWYKGLTFQLTKRMSHNVQFNLNYTYARAVDTAPLGGSTLATQGDAARSDPANLQRDKARPQLDQRHTFNGSIVAQSSVHRFGPVMDALLSDNQVAAILQFGSGLPLNIGSNRDLNHDGNNGDRPLFEPRNSLELPARWNVDLRYSRFVPLGGDRRVELQAEFKNVFNIVQESGVTTTMTVDPEGYPIDPAGERLPLSAISHDIATYTSNARGYEQRKFQLGLKFYF